MKPLIRVYSKPGCAICKAAKEKLDAMKLEYADVGIAKYMDAHKGWRYDQSYKIRAALAMEDDRLPLFEIDGHFYNYPAAMLALKNMARAKEDNRP